MTIARKEICLLLLTLCHWQSLPVTLRVWLFEICKKKQYKDIPYIYMHTPYDFCIFRI